jgi:hypothetical protein
VEADLYQDLVEDVFGVAVRLEQERIALPHVCAALPVPAQVSHSRGY